MSRKLVLVPLLLLAALGAAWLLGSVGVSERGAGARGGGGDGDARPPPAAGPPSVGTAAKRPAPAVLRGDPPAERPLEGGEGGLFGLVLDGATGEPVPGVPLHALHCDAYHGEHRRLATCVSDAAGRYWLRVEVPWDEEVVVLALGGGRVNDVAWPEAFFGEDPLPPGFLAEVRGRHWIAVDVRVKAAARVEGTVRLSDGSPAVGATVGLASPFRFSAAFPWEVLPRVATDADGRYVVDAVPEIDGVGVAAESAQHVAVWAEAADLPGGTTVRRDLAFAPPHRAVLQVVDRKDGAPVAGAEVRFEWLRFGLERADEEWHEVLSDAQGRAVLEPVPDDGLSVSVRKEGYVPFGYCEEQGWGDVLRQTAPGVWTATAGLVALVRLEGRIGGPRLENGFLRAEGGTRHLNGRWDGSARVADDGTFTLWTPPDGRYLLRYHGRDGSGRWAAEREVEPGTAGLVLEPLLVERAVPEDRSAWGRWTLVLRDPRGRPLVSAHVEREGPAESDLLTLLPEEGLEEGRVEVLVAPDDVGAWFSIQFGRTVDDERLGRFFVGPFGAEGGAREITFPEAKTIRGRVLAPDGTPLQGVSLEACPLLPHDLWAWRDDAARTDAEGCFVLERLLQPRYRVSVQPHGTWILPPTREVEAGASDVVFHVGASVARTIVVEDPDGRPLGDADVWIGQQDGLRGPGADYETRYVSTGTDGCVRVEALEADGVYDLEVRPPRGRVDLLARAVRPWRPRDDRVRLERALAVGGRVVDSAGRPQPGAEVFFEHPGGRSESARADAEGRFRFDGVAPGAVRLGACFAEVHPDGFALPFSVDAVAGALDVQVRLDSARDLLVVLDTPETLRAQVGNLDLTRLDGDEQGSRKRVRLSRSGRALFQGLEPERTYRLWGGPTEAGRFVLAEIGPDDREVTVTLESGGIVEGRLEHPPGRQPAGVRLLERGIHCQAAVLADDTWRLVGVPPGTWTIEAWWGERRARREGVREGDAVTFDFR